MKIVSDHVTFSKTEATGLIKAAGKDKDRPRLVGVWIDARQGRAYTTDGCRLILMRSKHARRGTQASAPYLVPRKVWQSMLRLVPAKGTLRVRSILGKTCLDAIDAKGVVRGSTSCTAPDVEPPAIDNVLPNPEASPSPSVPRGVMNGAYLADVGAVQLAAGSDSVRVTPPSHSWEPWAFYAEGDDASLVYIVMAVNAKENETLVSEETAIAYAAAAISDRRGLGKQARAALRLTMQIAAESGSAAPPAPPAPEPRKNASSADGCALRLVN